MAVKLIRLYPHPDLADRGGIPAAGEFYTAEDARRLVGAGLAVRQAPRAVASSSTRRTPARPVKEG